MYAFAFDASACTGCKACQAACKDKNNLPLGVLWRRVYEISGGDWVQAGNAWNNRVFAFNLSIACNHCVHPKCAGVCPVDAFQVRSDGIVRIDASKCIGCGYCGWACPYDAPQMDAAKGVMTKCDLCCDLLDAGIPPVCVASCPMRCLELVSGDDPELTGLGMPLWKITGAEHPHPLPGWSRTEPRLLIKPHPAMHRGAVEGSIANREEVLPGQAYPVATAEIPLIIFTLLIQMAIGSFWLLVLLHRLFGSSYFDQFQRISVLAVGLPLLISLVVSFLHLKSPGNAWRTLNHLQKSWLSREILFVLSFLAGYASMLTFSTFNIGGEELFKVISTLTSILGLAAIISMQKVYWLRSIPAWNTSRTVAEFILASLLLGFTAVLVLLPAPLLTEPLALTLAVCMACWSIIIIMTVFNWWSSPNACLTWIRCVLVLACLAVAGGLSANHSEKMIWLGSVLFCLALAEEVIGRWQFYSRRSPGI
jgi:anaerobic dimethyl sulfoxide reductase subunit B (iron-sulfur subunit)